MEASKKITRLLLLLVFLAACVWLFFNYQSLIDQVVVSRFKPSQEVSQIASDIKFTDRGKFLFLAAQPELDNRDNFNSHCSKKAEQTVVLGCYLALYHLYIYDVSDPRLAGVRQVTAAHEMLHVAYDRLSYIEKQRVNNMIEAALAGVEKTQPDLAERLKIYDKIEPGERINELHSILGTEAAVLPADLEQYYTRYFVSRSVITNFAASYDKVFSDIKNQQDQLSAELDALSKEINSLTAQYNADTTSLTNDIEAFNSRANLGGGSQGQSDFNAARSELISRRDVLGAQRITINAKVDQYEAKRVILENLNGQVKDLNSKIDSASVPSL